MNILVLSDIEASGEWLALQTLIEESKKMKEKINFYLIAYGKNKLLLKKKLFTEILIIQKPHLIRPLRYYRQIIIEFYNGLKAVRKFISKGIKFNYMISTEYTLFLPSFILLPFIRSIFFFYGFRHFFHLGFNNLNLYMFIVKSLERIAWLLSHEIIIPSIYAKKLFEKELGWLSYFKKIHIIQTLIRPEMYKNFKPRVLRFFKKKYHMPGNKTIILYCGLIDPRKGIIELVEAFKQLVSINRDLFLIINYFTFKIDKQYFIKLKKIIKQKLPKNSFLFLTDLNSTDLLKLYKCSNIGILPSLQETSSLFFLESTIANLPFFSTAVGNPAKYLKQIDPLFLLKNNSPKTIVRALKTYFSKDDSWRSKIKGKIQNTAEKFDFRSSTERFLQILKLKT